MKNEPRTYYIISAVSLIVPLAVGFLFYSHNKNVNSAGWVTFLPHLNAAINSLTSVLLISGFGFVKFKRTRVHRFIMTTSVFMGIIFFISYLVYHYSVPGTVFGDTNHDRILDIAEAEAVGNSRNIYLLVLFSHIVLAAMVVPFVLFAFYFALTDNIQRHKKTVRFALPVWLYVSLTGVLVYWLIRPYY
jgi:putative membrane protein